MLHSLPFALALLTNAWDSPFIVPVAGCFMILGIVVASIVSGIRTREMESQERLAAIAKGLPLPPTQAEIAAQAPQPTATFTFKTRTKSRLAGLILIGGGLGLILTCAAIAVIVGERNVLCGAAAGLIPMGIGIAMLADAAIQKREAEAAAATQPPVNY